MKKYAKRYEEDSYAEMLLRFAIAAEYKDDETGKHIVRVSDYSTAIAKSLKLPQKEIEIIRYASIMHDIGKIGIPDRILHKKVLTGNDYKRIKEHTIIGNRIFRGSNSYLLRAAGEIALSHHEWYDGNGYPFGLKGDGIPLGGRIVALADSFDAMVSQRSYKKAESFANAVSTIKKRKGRQFDPHIVEVFLKNLAVVRDIFNANKTISDFLRENR